MSKKDTVVYMYDKRNKTTSKTTLKTLIDAINIYSRHESVVYSLTKKVDVQNSAFYIKH